MYTVGLYTLGCKVSQYETEAIAERFEELGCVIQPFTEKNDIYVINTCTVTAESDRKSRQFIRRAIKQNPEAVIAVVGCYSQRSSEEIRRINGVDIIIGTDGKLNVVNEAIGLVEKRISGEACDVFTQITDVGSAGFEPMRITKAPRTRAYVKIEDGCECRCTYCAISDARGRVRSKPRAHVLSEVKALFDSGIGEVVLTGIETASYGRDFEEKYTLADLILELDSLCPNGKIRLGSLSPELIGPQFVEKTSKTRILLPHFHLSIQSGSNKILAAMKRRYTRERALENIERLRDAFVGANFTTDLMVGFPGETDEDFLLTCDFLNQAQFLDAHVFAYSKRERTPAAEYKDQIPEDVKKQRSKELIRCKNLMRDRLLDRIVCSGESVLAIAESLDDDGKISMHSESFVEIKLDHPCPRESFGALQGRWITVKPIYHKNGVLFCEA
jgi:threonylcarbamoyladenosine tRNA methylthiotransferase MtaB